MPIQSTSTSKKKHQSIIDVSDIQIGLSKKDKERLFPTNKNELTSESKLIVSKEVAFKDEEFFLNLRNENLDKNTLYKTKAYFKKIQQQIEKEFNETYEHIDLKTYFQFENARNKLASNWLFYISIIGFYFACRLLLNGNLFGLSGVVSAVYLFCVFSAIKDLNIVSKNERVDAKKYSFFNDIPTVLWDEWKEKTNGQLPKSWLYFDAKIKQIEQFVK